MKYSKSQGKRELLLAQKELVVKERDESLEASAHVILEEQNSYAKEDGELEPKIYILFVEGDNKEPDYFMCMQGKHAFSGLKIAYMPLANCAEYKGNLAQKMCGVVDETYRNKKVTIDKEAYSVFDIDDIFIVMDVDVLHDEIAKGMKLESRATWIVSNPCFEIWLYYAFRNTPKEDFSCENFEDSKRSSRLKEELDSVHKGGIGCNKAFMNMKEAICNAKQHYRLDDDGVPDLYATGMHILADRIFCIIQSSLEERISKRQKEIEKFRRDNYE